MPSLKCVQLEQLCCIFLLSTIFFVSRETKRSILKEKFHIVFYAVYSGNSKIINEYFCYIRTEKCRECRSEVDIFHTKIQEGEKHNNGFLFVPGDIINDWKLIDIVESNTSFNFNAITARE